MTLVKEGTGLIFNALKARGIIVAGAELSEDEFLAAAFAAIVDSQQLSHIDVMAEFHAKGDGSADDTLSIQEGTAAALETGRELYYPPGRYKTTGDIAVDIGSGNNSTGPVVGLKMTGVPGQSIIMPASGVSTVFNIKSHTNTDGTTNRLVMDGLRIDGANGDDGLIGLDLGNDAAGTYGRYHLSGVEVLRCGGAGGLGLIIRNVVDFFGFDCYFGRSDTNVKLLGLNTSLPTTVTFLKCKFREAIDKGVVIDNAIEPSFLTCTFESNTHEGLYIVPSSGNSAQRVVVDGCHFEGNYVSNAAKAQVHVDGTAGLAELSIRKCFMDGVARSLYMKDALNFVVDDCFTRQTSDSVYIDTGCSGAMLNWPEATRTYATCVTNLSPTTTIRMGARIPSIFASLGVQNAAAASSPGTVTGKVEVFKADGTSLGFVAVYDVIT